MTTIDRATSENAFAALAELPGYDPALDAIVDAVHAGRRLSREDGLTLFETPDIWTVFSLADLVRRRLHGDVAWFNINRHINYSNVCALSCKFCAFFLSERVLSARGDRLDRPRVRERTE